MKSTFRKIYRGATTMLVGENYPKLIKRRAIERPHYGYIVYWAAELAKRLGERRISVLEFGVAGGNGLVNLEYHAERVSKLTGIEIELYGFDTGEGLPPPEGYRDLPFFWQAEHFKMDVPKLQSRLTKAKLVLGNVRETAKSFISEFNPAPIAAISFDLDYYSSTVDAFELLRVPVEYRLPRVQCYFDDIQSGDLSPKGQGVGVELAINEFNATYGPEKLISPLSHLEFTYAPARAWHRRIYSYADYAHPRGDDYILAGAQQLALN